MSPVIQESANDGGNQDFNVDQLDMYATQVKASFGGGGNDYNDYGGNDYGGNDNGGCGGNDGGGNDGGGGGCGGGCGGGGCGGD